MPRKNASFIWTPPGNSTRIRETLDGVRFHAPQVMGNVATRAQIVECGDGPSA